MTLAAVIVLFACACAHGSVMNQRRGAAPARLGTWTTADAKWQAGCNHADTGFFERRHQCKRGTLTALDRLA